MAAERELIYRLKFVEDEGNAGVLRTFTEQRKSADAEAAASAKGRESRDTAETRGGVEDRIKLAEREKMFRTSVLAAYRRESSSHRESEAQAESQAARQSSREWENSFYRLSRQRASFAEALTQVGEGSARLGRGLAMMGLAGEEDLEKIAKSLVKIQGLFDTVVGSAKLFSAISKMSAGGGGLMGLLGGGRGGIGLLGGTGAFGTTALGATAGIGALLAGGALAAKSLHEVSTGRAWEPSSANGGGGGVVANIGESVAGFGLGLGKRLGGTDRQAGWRGDSLGSILFGLRDSNRQNAMAEAGIDVSTKRAGELEISRMRGSFSGRQDVERQAFQANRYRQEREAEYRYASGLSDERGADAHGGVLSMIGRGDDARSRLLLGDRDDERALAGTQLGESASRRTELARIRDEAREQERMSLRDRGNQVSDLISDRQGIWGGFRQSANAGENANTHEQQKGILQEITKLKEEQLEITKQEGALKQRQGRDTLEEVRAEVLGNEKILDLIRAKQLVTTRKQETLYDTLANMDAGMRDEVTAIKKQADATGYNSISDEQAGMIRGLPDREIQEGLRKRNEDIFRGLGLDKVFGKGEAADQADLAAKASAAGNAVTGSQKKEADLFAKLEAGQRDNLTNERVLGEQLLDMMFQGLKANQAELLKDFSKTLNEKLRELKEAAKAGK